MAISESSPEGGVMGIGVSLFLIAVGAILKFALHHNVSVPRIGVVDTNVVGWILMAVGAIGLVVAVAVGGRRRREVVTREPHDTSL
jgi:Domain of unknown function (DUF6458)